MAVVALSSTKAMLFGGCSKSLTAWVATNGQSYIYDFATGIWTKKANLLVPRCMHGSGTVWLNGKKAKNLLFGAVVKDIR